MFPLMLTKRGKLNYFLYLYIVSCMNCIVVLDPHPPIHGKPDSHGGSPWSRRREVTVTEKRISVPGCACYEGVPSPL